jgi:hypothetical protein
LNRERSRLRRDKLVSLRTLLEAGQDHGGEGDPDLCDAVGMNELEATAEKCSVLKGILTGLVDKHTALEQQCMGLEERTSREAVSLRAKEEHLLEGRIWKVIVIASCQCEANAVFCAVRCTLQLLLEDIRSAQWNFEVGSCRPQREHCFPF